LSVDQTRTKDCPVCGLTVSTSGESPRILRYKMNSHIRTVHRNYLTSRLAWNSILSFGGVIGGFAIIFTFAGVCSRYSSTCSPPLIGGGVNSPWFAAALGPYLALMIVGFLLRQTSLNRIKNKWDETPHLDKALTQSEPFEREEGSPSVSENSPDASVLPPDYFSRLAQQILPSSSNQNTSTDPTNYFDALTQRLSDVGFDVERNVSSDPYVFEIVATGPGIPRGRQGSGMIAVLGMQLSAPTATGVTKFSSFAMKYIVGKSKGSMDVDVLAVVAAEDFSPEIISWISEYHPGKKTLLDRFEFPILVSTKTGQVYCFQKTPFNAGLHYRTLRKWAAKHIGFQNPMAPTPT
jgi:hypothetical protein